MDTVILPAMTYGAETWNLTKHPEKKLASGLKKHREIVVQHHGETQDPESSYMI